MKNTAIQNLNNVIDTREKMINKILYSKTFKTNNAYDSFERKLETKSFAELQKMNEKIIN